jgi:hypothetical protein
MDTKNLIICVLVVAVLFLYFNCRKKNESYDETNSATKLQSEDQIQKSIMRWKMEQAKGSGAQ